nr:hypothetical protein [Tanacetum cinerariifolium]
VDHESDASKWFRSTTCHKLIKEWDAFLESVRNQFRPSKYEDPKGMLSKLLQTRMVTQYQSEFEMNRVTNIPETLLKPTLPQELLVSNPMILGMVFSLTRVTEARLKDQVAPATINASKTMTSIGNQKKSTPRVGITSSTVNENKPSLLPTPP